MSAPREYTSVLSVQGFKGGSSVTCISGETSPPPMVRTLNNLSEF